MCDLIAMAVIVVALSFIAGLVAAAIIDGRTLDK